MLGSVYPAFRELIAGKIVVSTSMRIFAGIGRTFEVPPTPVNAFFAAGRRVENRVTDSMTFSDGSTYCDQGMKERYHATPDEIAQLDGLGLEKSGADWFFAPPRHEWQRFK